MIFIHGMFVCMCALMYGCMSVALLNVCVANIYSGGGGGPLPGYNCILHALLVLISCCD